MRRQKRLQRLQEAVDRGEAKMPKPRARSTTAGTANRSKRKHDDAYPPDDVAVGISTEESDCEQLTAGVAPLPLATDAASPRAPIDAPLGPLPLGCVNDGGAQPLRRTKAAKRGIAKTVLPQIPDACLDKNLQGPLAFSPTREERMAQVRKPPSSHPLNLAELCCLL